MLARQECAIHSQIKHENIVELYHYTETSSTIELILEYCDNHSYFEDRLEETKNPIEDDKHLKKYAIEILRALAYIHDWGIIHADIKLPNLALDKSQDPIGVVKIIDFGLSLIRDPELGGNAIMPTPMGTFGYMAPEITGVSIAKFL